MTMIRTLYVCTGNVNRSACAGVLSLIAGGMAASAGTSPNARRGRPMSSRMRQMVREARLPYEQAKNHRSRWLSDVDLAAYDRIVGFQPSHRAAVLLIDRQAPYHDVLSLVPHPEWTKKVPDPAFHPEVFPELFKYLLRVAEKMP